MVENWYQLIWNLVYFLTFALGIGIAAWASRQKGNNVQEEDKALDKRRSQGGYTFNAILDEMRDDIAELEEHALEDVVKSDSPEQRELAAGLIQFCRMQLERIDRLKNMRRK